MKDIVVYIADGAYAFELHAVLESLFPNRVEHRSPLTEKLENICKYARVVLLEFESYEQNVLSAKRIAGNVLGHLPDFVCVSNQTRENLIDMLQSHKSLVHIIGKNPRPLSQDFKPLIESLLSSENRVWSSLAGEFTNVIARKIFDPSGIQGIVEEVLSNTGCFQVFADFPSFMATTTWELLTNAVFDARRGTVHAIDRSETKKIIADRHKKIEVEVKYGFNDKFFAVSVKDHFGGLTKDIVIKNWSRTNAKGHDQFKTDKEGAGVGMFLVLSYTSHVYICVDKGKSTEIVCVAPLFKRQKQFDGFLPSVNFLIKE